MAPTAARPQSPFLSLRPFYAFAKSEPAKLTTQIHAAFTTHTPHPEDAPDALARLGDIVPDLATQYGELGCRLLAPTRPDAALALVDAMRAEADQEARYRLRVARSQAYIEQAERGAGLSVLRAALDELGDDEDPVEHHHILAHALGDFAAFANDEEAARLALDVVGEIPLDEGRDDVKGRVVRRLAMRNDTEATTAELVRIADQASGGFKDEWEDLFTRIRVALAFHLVGEAAEAASRWETMEDDLPSEPPLGPVGAVHVTSLFQARIQAGQRAAADEMLPLLEAEFRSATHDFTATLMEGEAKDGEDLDDDVLERMDSAHVRMTAVAQGLALAAQFGQAPDLLQRTERLLSSLPSPHPMARTWRTLAESAYALGDERTGRQAWKTALAAEGHKVRELGPTLREVLTSEFEIGLSTQDPAHVESAAKRLRQARGPAGEKEAVVANLLLLDLQMRLEAADGVTYFYE